MATPGAHISQAHELRVPEMYQLVKLELIDEFGQTIYVRFCSQQTIEFDGFTWTWMPFEINGEGRGSDGEKPRPKLTLPNTEGYFSYYTERGLIERRRLWRYEVLPDLVASGSSEALVRLWQVGRVSSEHERSIVLELRGMNDGPNFKLPARRYIAPEFKTVRL